MKKLKNGILRVLLLFLMALLTGCTNNIPVAVIDAPKSAVVGQGVIISALSSYDMNRNDKLTYKWAITSKPEGSQVTIDNPTARDLNLQFDKPGVFILRLIVDDGGAKSEPAFCAIVITENLPF